MIGDKWYAKLEDAFNDITSDDQTITILRDDLTITKPIYVSHVVYLEPYHYHSKLKCNFNIYASGIVYIPSSIEYEGDTKLALLGLQRRNS
ncbi:MAG: hypothetical protein MJ223_03910 [Mycoplasmoidaceae bacterium]|nr:hypothetical protein [Mycoplasmoidaceae bacterium]